ncbi:hypothetical protein QOT17_000168 [Balamuthia mandrillaris]
MRFSCVAVLCILVATLAALSVRAEECCETNGECFSETCFQECEPEVDGLEVTCDCKMPSCGIVVIVSLVVTVVSLLLGLVLGLWAWFEQQKQVRKVNFG